MMSSSDNQLSIKVYYIENKATKEIRKFSVEADVVGSFEYLIGKIRQAFPDLLRKDFEVFWKDEEDDYLTISSNDELDQAIQAIPVGSSNLKLFVKGKQENKSKEPEEEHPGITCDGCEGNIKGYRYKCSQCYDFDLCSSCEGKGVHPSDHEMILIKSPRQFASGFYMRHPKFSRGHCRGGPFGRPRRGPFGFYRGGPFHGRRSFHCRFGQGNPCGMTPDHDQKEGADGNQNEEKFKECVGRLASAFGLDPDVAVSSVKSFFDDFPKEGDLPKEDAKTEQKTQQSQEEMDEFVNHVAGSFGIDPTLVAHVTTTLFPQCTKNDEDKTEESSSSKDEDVDFKAESSNISTPENVDNGDEKMDAESNESEEKKDIQSFEDMVSHFSKQFGVNPENQLSAEGLGDLLQRMFQSLPNQNSTNQVAPQNFNKNKEEEKEEPKKPDEFIFLDAKDDQLSEEEKFQQRLDIALRQMEAMGFDNDNGWLSQLLVSKELSIERVLDALNPTK